MKKFLLVPLAALALVTSARAADTAAAPAKPGDAAPTMTRSGPGQATSHRVVTIKAKVLAVDQEKRTLTLEGKDGKPETFAVSSKVKRLKGIAPGDFINVKYEQGVALQFLPEGEKSPEPAGMVQLDKAGADAPLGFRARPGTWHRDGQGRGPEDSHRHARDGEGRGAPRQG